jgi:uncharacterized RDD family membrane protein YckC
MNNDSDDLYQLDGARSSDHPLLNTETNDELSLLEGKTEIIDPFSMFNIAPLGRRMISMIIDLLFPLFVFTTFLIFAELTDIILIPAEDSDGNPTKHITEFGTIVLALGSIITHLFLNAFFVIRNRQSLSKFLFRIRVVNNDGFRPTLTHYFLFRELPILSIILLCSIAVSTFPLAIDLIMLVLVFDVALLFSKNARTLRDRFAKTVLVRSNFIDPADRA